jgi:rRNA processing protein Gar1
LLGGNIEIMVNAYTNQQISSTTIQRGLQRVGIDTYIGPCADSYNRIKMTVRNNKQRWKRSKQTMEAIKSQI